MFGSDCHDQILTLAENQHVVNKTRAVFNVFISNHSSLCCAGSDLELYRRDHSWQFCDPRDDHFDESFCSFLNIFWNSFSFIWYFKSAPIFMNLIFEQRLCYPNFKYKYQTLAQVLFYLFRQIGDGLSSTTRFWYNSYHYFNAIFWMKVFVHLWIQCSLFENLSNKNLINCMQ